MKTKLHISVGYQSMVFIFVYILTFALCCECPADSEITKKLLDCYRSYGMPFAPIDANLVIYDNGLSYIGPDGSEKTNKYLAFLVSQDSQSQSQTLLIGPFIHRIENWQGEIKFVKADDIVLNDIQTQWHNPVFELNITLFTAIQCKNRGWDNLAEALIEKGLKESYGHQFSAFYQPENLEPKTALAMAAWAYWGNQLIEPDSDRKLIAERMKSLINEESKLNIEYNRNIIESLEAALVPSEAKPGTIEALIDELVEMCTSTGALMTQKDYDAKYLKLAELGFKAIPDLIEHLDDKRLTRSVTIGFNNFPSYPRTVGDVVSDLLQDLSGKELGQNWLDRQRGWRIEEKDALSWWSKARKAGEEKYFLDNVLPQDTKNKMPNRIMLHIIAKRYYAHLPDIYKTVLDKRSYMQSWPVAEVFTESAIPKKQKIELFTYACKNKNLEHRRAAFWELKEIDPGSFIELLLQTLNELPSSPKEPYWNCREASFANLVMETNNDEIWETFKHVAKKSDVGLRMEFLNVMNYSCIGEKNFKRRLDFLKSFLNDVEVRDINSNTEMFDGPCAESDFPILEVRNLAAKEIGWILKVSEMPAPNWTPEQWASFRLKVEKELENSGM